MIYKLINGVLVALEDHSQLLVKATRVIERTERVTIKRDDKSELVFEQVYREVFINKEGQ